MKGKHVIVHGEVQGVSYRAAAVDRAASLGVAGWVRNTDGGSVEMVVEGEDDAVDAMLAWAGEGSRGADVDRVESGDRAVEGLSGFDQR